MRPYLLIAIAAVLAIWLIARFSSSATRPLANTVSISFVGYTNNSAGLRNGLFRITNPSAIPIDVGSYHDVQLETSNGWSSQGLQPARGFALLPKHNALLEIPAPRRSLKQRWRVWLNYRDHPSFPAECLLRLKHLGLPIFVRIQAYSACTEPIDP